MIISVNKSYLKGTVNAPSSKSYTIRALICAALAEGESTLINPLDADDSRAALEVLADLGAKTEIIGNKWIIKGSPFKEPYKALFCRDSAATMRFLTAICAGTEGVFSLTAGASLSKRPMTPLLDALNSLGASCHQTKGGTIIVKGRKLKGGEVEISGRISSQYITALLMLAPLTENGIYVKLNGKVVSKPYLSMTLETLNAFGIKVEHSPSFDWFKVSPQKYSPAEYEIEGDWSSASYPLALGAIAGEVSVKGLNLESFQADRIMLNFLREMGADLSAGEGIITVNRSPLKAIDANLADCIDLLPTMAVLAAAAKGESVLSGISKARIKESNRVLAMRQGLEQLGIEVREEEDALIIEGGKPKSGTVIDSHNDHRIAMAFGSLAVLTEDTKILNAECVSKTYPNFWKDLKHLKGEVSVYEQ